MNMFRSITNASAILVYLRNINITVEYNQIDKLKISFKETIFINKITAL